MIKVNVEKLFLSPNYREQQASNGSREKKIAKSLSRLSNEMWKTTSGSGSNHGVMDPSGFRREMGTFAPKFMGFEQHDSQEFLLYALDGIHTELNRVIRPKQVNRFEYRINSNLRHGLYFNF